MLLAGGLATSQTHARQRLLQVLESGHAAAMFAAMCAALGGPIDFMECFERYLPKAHFVRAVYAADCGVVASIDTRTLGVALVSMGGGRRFAGEKIDYSVGMSDFAELGQRIERDTPLALIHVRTEADAQAAASIVIGAFHLEEIASTLPPLIDQRIIEAQH